MCCHHVCSIASASSTTWHPLSALLCNRLLFSVCQCIPLVGFVVSIAKEAEQPSVFGFENFSEKEGACKTNAVQPPTINATFMRYVKAVGFEGNRLQHICPVKRSIGKQDKRGNDGFQIQLGVQLDAASDGAEGGPVKRSKAQINGCFINGKDVVFQFRSRIALTHIPAF